MLRTLLLTAAATFAAVATAQTVVIPNGTAATAGDINNAFPWGNSAASFPGLRQMCIYDASNFTSQGITFPILITALRWRPDEASPAATGGTFAQARVELSTAPMNYTALTTSYASNHGSNRTVVHNGPVVHGPSGGATGGTPKPFSVDIPLTNTFVYNPTQGDLVIDCDYPGGTNFSGGALPQMDVQQANSQAARVYSSATYPVAGGLDFNHGVVVQVSYVPAAGAATSTPYGTGCYDRAQATFYQLFAGGTFDLSNNGFTLFPNGPGYTVVAGAGPWHTPTGAILPLTHNSVSTPQLLPFPVNYPGGSTQVLHVSSNGFIWPQFSTDHGCCAGDPAALRQLAARWCPLWTDLEPGAPGASVRYDMDHVIGAAWITFTNVPETNTSNLNTFQIAFSHTGQIEFRYGACSVAQHTTLTGWSPGGGVGDPGSIDLSTALPIATGPDLPAMRLLAGSRPVVGTNVTMTASNVPAGSPLGSFVAGVTKFDPGLSLAAIGMPGCLQYLSLDASIAFLPTGGMGSYVFGVPNAPALSGTHVHFQAAAIAIGSNALGIVSSNAVDLRVGTQ